MKNFISISISGSVYLFLFSLSLFSQQLPQSTYMVVMKAPRYVIQVNTFYNKSLLELSGTYNSDFHSDLVTNGESFGTHDGFGAGAVSKISLDEKSNYWFTQSLSINRIQSYLLEDKTKNMDQGKAGFTCFTAGLGMEYNFTPNYSVKIYAGAELNASVINGTMNIWYYNNRNPYVQEYKILSSFRMGCGFTAGGAYMVSKKIGLNLNLKFSSLNLFFRNSEGTSEDKEFYLRDGNSSSPLLFSGSKSFAFYSFGAGVSFYFGTGEKRYKLN
jgi:hypothetical protein